MRYMRWGPEQLASPYCTARLVRRIAERMTEEATARST